MTAAPSSRARPYLTFEVKRGEHVFEEAKHPRDRHGRFMHIGDHVDLGGGHSGTVTGTTSDGRIEVRKAGGAMTHVDPGKVTRIAAGGAPSKPYADRAPRIGDVVVLDDGREGEVRHVYADGRSIKFSFVERNGSITREKVGKDSIAKITSAAPEPLASGERRAPNLSGIEHLPDDVRQELTAAVQEMTSLYDVPFAGVTARAEDWHGGDSFAIGGTTIMFNPKIADLAYRDQHLKNGSGYTLGRTMREAFIHEFGHTIDRQYLADQGKQKRKGAAPLHQMFIDVEKSGDRVAQGEMNPDYNPSDPDSTLWLYPDGTHADLSERVSSYAASGNVGEAVAESFLAGHLGRTNRYTLAVRAAFAPHVRQDGGSAVVGADDGHRVVEPSGPRPVPGPDPSGMTSAAITTELRALGESLNSLDPQGKAWGPIAARRDLLANELLNRAGYNPQGGRKAVADATLRAMGTERSRPYLAVEEKRGAFDSAKHPRDRHGRFAHIGDLVQLANGGHGRITRVGKGGKLTVQKDTGGTVKVDSHNVAKVTGEATGVREHAPNPEGDSHTRGTKYDTPVGKHGMIYSAAADANPRVQALKNDPAAWDKLPTEAYRLDGAKLQATEKFLKSGSIDKTVSGREPIRKDYAAHILRTDQGDVVVDGHHRVAMYHALNRPSMPAKIKDERSPKGASRRPKPKAEPVQVTDLKPGDRIQHRKGTNVWQWVNHPSGTKFVPLDERPTEGVVAKVEHAGSTGSSGLRSGYGQVEITLTDGKIIRWNKVAKVDRLTADSHGLTPLPRDGRPDATGTLDDPIAVGDDIERAARLIAEGKHVRLDQPDQVVTLVDKLRKMVADAKARGEKAPTYDLAKVSVPGTNLFAQESKGIPRINMPQFRGVPTPGSPAEAFVGAGGDPGANIEQPFRDALAAMGIPTRLAKVHASHLRASQNELDGAKVAGIASGMAAGKVKDVPIFVTRDNYVIDGHHRWAAKIVDGLSGGDPNMSVEIVDLDIGAALDYANAFARVMGIASQGVDSPAAKERKVILVSTGFPADFREQMTKALNDPAAATGGDPTANPTAPADPDPADPTPADGAAPSNQTPPTTPQGSRIVMGIDRVYGMTAVHHVRRGIDAAYTRHARQHRHRHGEVSIRPRPSLAIKEADGGGIPDLADIGHPAPGADPVGAHAFFAGPDGTEAWLHVNEGEPVGYLRDASRPLRAVRVSDPQAWASIVDNLGLREDVVPSLPTPAPIPAVDDEEPDDDAIEGETPEERQQTKGARGAFDEAKHPRDKHGRFAHIGDLVHLDGGGKGHITGIESGGKLTVRKSDGSTVKVDSKKVAAVAGGTAHAGDSKPSAPGTGGGPAGRAAHAVASAVPGEGGSNGKPGRSAAEAVAAVHGDTGNAPDGTPSGPSDADMAKQLSTLPPGPEFDALQEQMTQRANDYATGLLSKIGQVEPGVTKNLTDMAAKYGGRMEGLDFRIKTEDSLTRKIRDKSLVSGKPMDAVTGKIGDALRYTMILDENHYAEGAGAALRDFEAQGMTVVDKDNSWHPGNVYQGINSVMRTPDGIMFELQFHTQKSFDTKMSTHADYELARNPKAPLADRLAAWNRMADLQSKVPVPQNVTTVGDMRVYDPPAAPISSAAPPTPAAAVKALYDTLTSKGGGES